jgi:catechol-2,3-dioxygenase
MTNETKLGLAQIGQISVTVNNLPQAVEFYRDKLGSSSCSTPATWRF